MITIENLVTALKKEYKVSKDKDLASIFNVTPYTFSSWKRSKGKFIRQVVKGGVKNGLDVNKIFKICGKSEPCYEKQESFPVLMAHDLYSYYLNPNQKISEAPRYSIPGNKKFEIGFQLISVNMEPTIKVGSLVFGLEVNTNELLETEVYAILVKRGGLFISRFSRFENGTYIFRNDNESYTDYRFEKDQIMSVFQIRGMLSKVN